MLNNFILSKINETEFRGEDENSSLYQSIILYKNTKLHEDKTENEINSNSATPELVTKHISYMDRVIAEERALAQQSRLDDLIIHLTKRMENALKYFSTEDADVSSAERLALDIEGQYSSRILGEILQNIYVQFNDYPTMQMGICKSIGQFELKDVMPWGPTMLMGLLSHKNDNVKEYAVAVVENWADTDLLPILKNLHCASVWLKEYIQDVVDYLEENYALHKKII